MTTFEKKLAAFKRNNARAKESPRNETRQTDEYRGTFRKVRLSLRPEDVLARRGSAERA
jgi:hypothetical protein